MVAAAKAVCQFSGVRVLCCQRGGSELSCGTEAAELVGMQARGAAVALPVPVPGAGGEGKVTRGSAQKRIAGSYVKMLQLSGQALPWLRSLHFGLRGALPLGFGAEQKADSRWRVDGAAGWLGGA